MLSQAILIEKDLALASQVIWFSDPFDLYLCSQYPFCFETCYRKGNILTLEDYWMAGEALTSQPN